MSSTGHGIDVRTTVIILIGAIYSVFSKTLGGFAYVPEADEAGNSLSLALLNATNLLSNKLGFWNPYTNGGFPQFLNPYQFNGSTLFFLFEGWQGYALYFVVGHAIFGVFVYLIARSQYWIDQKLSILIALFSIWSISSWGEIDIMRTYQGYVLYLLPFSIYMICRPYNTGFGRIISGIIVGAIFGFFTPSIVYSYNVYPFLFVYICFVYFFDDDRIGRRHFYGLLSSFLVFTITSGSFSIPFLLSVITEVEMLTRADADVGVYPYFTELRNRFNVGLHTMLIDYKLLPLFIAPGIALIASILSLQKRFIVFAMIAVFFLSLFVIQNIIFQSLGDFFSPLKSLTVRTKLVSFMAIVLLNIEAVKVLTHARLNQPIVPVSAITIIAVSSFLAFMDTTRQNALSIFAAIQGESFQNIYRHPTLIKLSNDIQGTHIVVSGHFPSFRLHSEVFTLGRGMPLYPGIAMTAYGMEGHENILGLGYKRSSEYQVSSTPWSENANTIQDVYLDSLEGPCPSEWATHAYSYQSARLLKHAGVGVIASTVPLELDGYALTNADEVKRRRSYLCASSGAKFRDPEKSFTPMYIYKTADAIAPFVFAAYAVEKANNGNVLELLESDTSLVPGRTAILDRSNPLTVDSFGNCEASAMSYTRAPDYIDITLNVVSPCIVVVRQAFTKKWALTIDGKRTQTFPVNHAFTGFTIKPGQTKATLKFTPLDKS